MANRAFSAEIRSVLAVAAWVMVITSLSAINCDARPQTRNIRLYLHLPYFRQRNPPQTTHAKEPWEINRDVCPPSLCAWHEESRSHRPHFTGGRNSSTKAAPFNSTAQTSSVTSGTTDGSPFYNGDIVLDKVLRTYLFDEQRSISQKRRTKRAAVKHKGRIWPKGRIPYILAKDLAKSSRKSIHKAMKHIEDVTCIRFTKRKPKDVDYLYFINEPGCWSSIGRVKGQQKISLGEGCDFFGTVLHEITHALGFWHEQGRPDRDKYVRILKDNISKKSLKEFNKIKSSVTSSRGFPYDYRSVTHYSQTAFTRNGKNTIEVIGPGKKLKLRIGQRKGLSNLDVAQLNDMYKCSRKQDANQTVCPKGWQKFSRSCYMFVTKPKAQFSAASKHCLKLGGKLVSIDSSKEDRFLKQYLSKHHRHVNKWRTGARKGKNGFMWHDAASGKDKPLSLTKWQRGHPGSYSSLALTRDIKTKRFLWNGVWAGSQSQHPASAFPFICEKAAKRKCFRDKHRDGRSYRGRLSHTRKGITCQKWSSQWPRGHKIRITTRSRKEDGMGDHNMCRNPTAIRRERPWCFTTKGNKKWDYCDVSICK